MRTKFQQEVQDRIDQAINVKREIQKVNQENKELKRARRIREKANIDTDFLAINAEGTESYVIDKMLQMQHTRNRRNHRTEIAKEKRETAKEDKHMYNVLSLCKWDFLRVKRADYEAQVAERIRNRNQMKSLICQSFKDLYVRTMWEKFFQKRRRVKIMKLNYQCAVLISSNIKALCRKRGATMAIRLRKDVRESLVLAHRVSDDRMNQRAALLMKNFLESYNGRLKFEAKIRALPSYLYRWG